MKGAVHLRRVGLAIVVISTSIFTTTLFADPFEKTLPEIETLNGMKLQWIGKQMAINGLPTSMRAFSSDLGADQVLDIYQDRWKVRGLGQLARTEFDGAESVGMEYRGHYYSVQAYDIAGGSEGVLTVSLAPVEEMAPDFSTRFPLPFGSNVEQKIEAIDSGTRMETLIVTSDQSVGSLASYVDASLQREGWVDQNFSRASNHGQRVLSFQRGTELSQITIIERPPAYPDKTMMTVHWVKN